LPFGPKVCGFVEKSEVLTQMKYLIVIVTVPRNKTKTLAKTVVVSKLAACVNIIKGVRSVFWWQGKIDEAAEDILLIKTKSSLFGSLKSLIRKNHPYQVPEIIAVKIDKGDPAYLRWIGQSCKAV
jgi:periplasmic divalent cation tolerance protein